MRVFAALLLSYCVAVAVNAQLIEPIKLTSNFEREQLTGDGKHVIYLADLAADGGKELYSVPINGGSPKKLSATVPADREGVYRAYVSSKTNIVAYFHDVSARGTQEVFLVPADGASPPVKIALMSGKDAPGEAKRIVSFSDDQTYALIRGDLEVENKFDVWSIRLDGTSLNKLSQSGTLYGNIGLIPKISPDSISVVFAADDLNSTTSRLWTVPIAGGSPSPITDSSEPVTPNGTFSPDSSKVVYSLRDVSGQDSLWVRPRFGGARTRLSPTTLTNSRLCGFSADSHRVVFFGGASLYSSALDGSSAPVLLSPADVSNGGFVDCPYTSPPYGNEVRFLLCRGTRDCDLYRNQIGGGSLESLGLPTTLSTSYVFGTPDLSVAVIAGYDFVAQEEGLWALSSPSGNVKKLSTISSPISGYSTIFSGVMQTTQSHVLFISNHQNAQKKDLWSVAKLTGPARRISGEVPDGQGVSLTKLSPFPFLVARYSLSSDGKYVVFAADKGAAGQFELWSAKLTPDFLNLDDSDQNSAYGASTDGVMLLRYLLGFRGEALTNGATNASSRLNSEQIALRLEANRGLLDVDGDFRVTVSDGLMVLRRMLGLSGSAITAGAKNSVRSDEDVINAIDGLMP
jgi:Tol biopolymer transport system component